MRKHRVVKSRKIGGKSASIPNSRWAAYAAAGAASTLACASSAEAEIHYSGIVNHDFTPPASVASFPLDAGVDLQFRVGIPTGTGGESGGFGHLEIGGASNGFVATHPAYAGVYLSDLGARVNLSRQSFKNSCRFTSSSSNKVCYGGTIGGLGRFQDRGVGFIGFVFNQGTAASQYGWARIKTSGAPKYHFVLVDYGWGDPGDRVLTGQKRSQQTGETVPATGSLGLFAIGGAGLVAWRKRRLQGAAGPA